MATVSTPLPIMRPVPSGRLEGILDPVWAAAEADPLRRFFFHFSLIYIFMRFSLMHETFAILTHINIRPAVILGLPTLIGIVATGGIKRILRSSIGWMWVGFAVMMILSTPFSTWRGGSVEHLTMFFKSEWTMLLVMGGLAVTWREVKLLYLTLAASGLLSVAMAKLLLKQTGADGRMELDIPGSSIANSNDMAAHMLLLLPFLLFLMFRPKQNILIRLLSLAGVLTSIYVTLGSGSRGAMIALGVMGGVLFFQASGVRKVLVLLVLPVILVGVFFTLPAGVKNRLFNFEKSYAGEGAQGAEAVASLQIRNELMEHAVLYTLQHPLLGIGPGQFPVYDDRASRAEGKRRGSWHNPHIVYLQVSSECGIPALLFYLGAIGGSLMGSWRIWKQTGRYIQLSELRVAAQTLTLTALSFYTAILFLPIAYKMYLPALSGLAISIIFVAQKELAQIRQQTATPASGVAATLPAFEPLPQASLPSRRSTPKLTR